MKIILDTKSLLVGLSISAIAFIGISAKSSPESIKGKFTTEIRDNIVFVLNTETGEYIVATDLIDLRRKRWISGEFYKSFKDAKGNNN